MSFRKIMRKNDELPFEDQFKSFSKSNEGVRRELSFQSFQTSEMLFLRLTQDAPHSSVEDLNFVTNGANEFHLVFASWPHRHERLSLESAVYRRKRLKFLILEEFLCNAEAYRVRTLMKVSRCGCIDESQKFAQNQVILPVFHEFTPIQTASVQDFPEKQSVLVGKLRFDLESFRLFSKLTALQRTHENRRNWLLAFG